MTHLDLSRPQLGVIDAADLAATLDLLGYGITGGGDFRASATAIRQHPNAATLPLVVFDSARVGLRAWLTKHSADGGRVVILRSGDTALPADLGVSVSLPAPVNDIMAAAGWGPSPHPLGDAEVDAAGVVADLAAYRPAVVVEEPAEEQSALAPAPAPAPVVPAPSVVSAAAPSPVSAPAGAPAIDNGLPDWAQDFTLDAASEVSAVEPVVEATPHTPVASIDSAEAPPQMPSSLDDEEDESLWPQLSAPVSMQAHAAYGTPQPSVLPAAEVESASDSDEAASVSAPAADIVEPSPAAPVPVPQVPVIADVPAVPAVANVVAAPQSLSVPPVEPVAPAAGTPDGPVSAETFERLVEAARQRNVDEALGVTPAPAPTLAPTPPPAAEAPVAPSVTEAPVLDDHIEALLADASATEADNAPEFDPVDFFAKPVDSPPAPPSGRPTSVGSSTWPAAPVQPTPPMPPAAAVVSAEPPVYIDAHPYVTSTPATSVGEEWAPGQHALAGIAPEDRARVLVTFAGKGGVGKTTTAILLAQRAAEAGLRVVIVDMNRGQGDVRSYLQLKSNQLRTVYNAAISGNPADAVISPDELNQARHNGLQNLLFGIVLAPPAELADPEVVHAGVYGEVVAFLQRRVDLVVIDTQITEAHDTSGLIDRVVVPALSLGAYGFGLTDMSKPGMENLLERTRDFTTRGVPRSRVLLAVNKASGFDAKSQHAIERAFGEFATFAGTIGEDSRLADGLNEGHVNTASKAAAPLIDRVLHTVTGRPEFTEQSRRRRRALFGRRG